MSPDDNDAPARSGLDDTPEMRRILETVSNFSPEKTRELLERWFSEEMIPRDPTKPPEDEEPK